MGRRKSQKRPERQRSDDQQSAHPESQQETGPRSNWGRYQLNPDGDDELIDALRLCLSEILARQPDSSAGADWRTSEFAGVIERLIGSMLAEVAVSFRSLEFGCCWCEVRGIDNAARRARRQRSTCTFHRFKMDIRRRILEVQHVTWYAGQRILANWQWFIDPAESQDLESRLQAFALEATGMGLVGNIDLSEAARASILPLESLFDVATSRRWCRAR